MNLLNGRVVFGRSPLERCEQFGEVSVDHILGVTKVAVAIGDWSDVYLRITGKGMSIGQAAEDALEKLAKAGFTES